MNRWKAKPRGYRRFKISKQKSEYRRHQRKILAKLARKGVETTTPLNV